MSKFIEITDFYTKEKRLINVDVIEEVKPYNIGTKVFCRLSRHGYSPDDFTITAETYDQIKELIKEQNRQKGVQRMRLIDAFALIGCFRNKSKTIFEEWYLMDIICEIEEQQTIHDVYLNYENDEVTDFDVQ